MPIDYDQLLHDPLFKKRVSKRQYDAYLAGESELCEDVDARSVFALSWDGGGMLGSGVLSINEWKGFYFISSTDFDDEGPFSSLDEALNHEYLKGPVPNPELHCAELEPDQLFALARRLLREEGHPRVRINGKSHALKGDQWVAQKNEPS